MRSHLGRYATIGLASVLLTTGGCAARRPGPTPGIGGEPAPAATAEKRGSRKAAKALFIVAVVVVAAMALVVIAATEGAYGDSD